MKKLVVLGCGLSVFFCSCGELNYELHEGIVECEEDERLPAYQELKYLDFPDGIYTVKEGIQVILLENKTSKQVNLPTYTVCIKDSER